MGCASGSYLFNAVARHLAMVELIRPEVFEQLAEVVKALADHLHDDDWDVCDEVVPKWVDYPVIIEGLKRSGCVGGHGRDGD